jgi:hypothetical protein
MALKIDNVSDNVEKEINALLDHLQHEFGCISQLSKQFTSNGVCIPLEVTMPENQIIYIPGTNKIRIFSIDTKNQLTTLMYFPDSETKDSQLVGDLVPIEDYSVVTQLRSLLERSYKLLSECTDRSFDEERWKSEEHQKLMDDIADTLNIAEKNRR